MAPPPVTGDAHLQTAARAQHQEAALGARNRQRRVHHGHQHVVHRERALHRARQVQNGAQFGQVAAYPGRRADFFGPAHLFHQPLQLRAVQRKDELVGILRAEFDLVGIPQRLAGNPFAVHVRAVKTAAIFDAVLAVLLDDARVRAGDAAVADNEVALRLPPDRERQRVDGHPRVVSVRVDYHQRRRFHSGAPGPEGAPSAPGGGPGWLYGKKPHLFQFARAQRLAVRAIPAHFRPRQQDLETEVAFDLLPQAL